MYNPRLKKDVFKKEVRDNVRTLFRKEIEEATPQQLYQAVSYAIKEAIIDDWIETQKEYAYIVNGDAVKAMGITLPAELAQYVK